MKGFTLIELLAVIIIISLLALLTGTAVTKLVKDSKKDLSGVQIELIKSASETWGSDNLDLLPEEGSCAYLTLRNLKNSGLIGDSVIDPEDTTEFSDDMKIKIFAVSKGLGVSYEYEVNPSTIEGCTPIYNFICDFVDNTYGNAKQMGSKYSCKVNDTDRLDFYLLKVNDNDTVNLITASNLGATVSWNTVNTNEYENSILQNTMRQKTEGWTNIGASNIENPTADQMIEAGCVVNSSCPEFLIQNLDDVPAHGYWTSTVADISFRKPYAVTRTNGLFKDTVSMTQDNMYGMRPVITIPIDKLG